MMKLVNFKLLDINLLINDYKLNKSIPFISKLYSTYLMVVKFLKKFSKYQDRLNQHDEQLSNEKKFKIIEPLSNAYRNLEMFFIIRIPQNKIESICGFIDQLLLIDSNNINSRICWLGLNRFNDNCCEMCSKKIKFIKDSINIFSTNINDKLVFTYFQMIFYEYIGDFNQLKSIINSNISSHEIFIYYSSKLILFNNLNNDEITIMLNTILNYMSSDNCKFTTGHPFKTEIYYYITMMLINVYYNNNTNVGHQEEIIKNYEKGIECKKFISNYLTSKLKYLSNLENTILFYKIK